jgi:3-oxoacyl-[acyl-carrier protein] reductase
MKVHACNVPEHGLAPTELGDDRFEYVDERSDTVPHVATYGMTIHGDSALAAALRAADLRSDCATTVVVPSLDCAAKPFTQLTDADFDVAWEQPMRQTITAFQQAHQAGHTRIIALVPTIGMSGAPQLAHTAATAEAIRVMVKSAARQWGADGITVNCIAIAPSLFGIDATAVGAVSIAPPALASCGTLIDDIAPLIRLASSSEAHHLTGATLTADGGIWMAP